MDAKKVENLLNAADEVLADIESNDPVVQKFITVIKNLSNELRKGVKT